MSAPIDIDIMKTCMKCMNCQTIFERQFVYRCVNCQSRFCVDCAFNQKICFTKGSHMIVGCKFCDG